MIYSLSMTNEQHSTLKNYLIAPCGSEKVAWVLCSKASNNGRMRFMVKSIHPLTHDSYVNSSPTSVTWKTVCIIDLLDDAEKNDFALVKFHSHPKGADEFSSIDDKSDREILEVVNDWMEKPSNVLSCIMTPDGKIVGRKVDINKFEYLSHIMNVGYDLRFCERWDNLVPEFAQRNAQAFGEETFRIFSNLRVGVAGCSGTGSQVIEQLVRLGVSELVLVDFDEVEEKNLNRITNLSMRDANNQRIKVEALKERIEALGLGTKITIVSKRLQTKEAVKTLSVCDVVFGCLDTKGGRHTLNRLSSYYTIPYFDVGVRLDANGKGGIDGIHATVHYLQPGSKSLIHRGVYDMEDIRAENKRLEDPEGYVEERELGYVKGVNVDRPAVIPINAIAASFAVMDLLARIHDYRTLGNHNIDKILISISGEILAYEEVHNCDKDIFSQVVGRGDVKPLLDMPIID